MLAADFAVRSPWYALFVCRTLLVASLISCAAPPASSGKAHDVGVAARGATLAPVEVIAPPVVAARGPASAAPLVTAPAPFSPAVFPEAPFPYSADRRDGTFQNPVLYADYSDPDAIRVGNEYYLVASSFQCTPGLPILRSRDLVNWTLVGHALENLPDARYAEVRHGEGIWAPALREHDGTFFLFAPTPDEGIYVLTAPHPKGPWSKPRMLAAGKGLIDPCPLWDDDGKAYLVHAYARSRAGIRDRLRVRPMAPDASRLLGDGEIVFMQPEKHPVIEGPKFHKRNGWYYILAPAGGVPTGWQVALRSRHVYGPYEDRIVLAQGSTSVNGPHQGALVDTPNGESWFLHFQDLGLYGRVVHLNPVTWAFDWPLMGKRTAGDAAGEPLLRSTKPVLPLAPVAVPQTSDEFEMSTLGLQWQWHANHSNDWFSLTAKKGSLRLFPRASGDDFAKIPNLLLQKLPASAFTVETTLRLETKDAGVRAGLVVMGQSHAAIAVETDGAASSAVLIVQNEVVERFPVPRGPVTLRLTMQTGGLCRFEASAKGERHVFEHGFQASPGRWIGAKVGLFATSPLGTKPGGCADFEFFRFSAPASH